MDNGKCNAASQGRLHLKRNILVYTLFFSYDELTLFLGGSPESREAAGRSPAGVTV